MSTNEMLLEFADRFRLDGDSLRCVGCNRGIVASRMDEDFVHAADCTMLRTHGRPWSALQGILCGPLVDAMRAAQDDSMQLRAALRDIGKILDRGMIRHSVLCLAQRVGEPCVCGRLEIRAIVERAVGGES